MLRMIAFGHKTNILPIMKQNRGSPVLRKDSSKEQTIDQFIVPVLSENPNPHRVSFSHRDLEILSAPQTDLIHMANVC